MNHQADLRCDVLICGLGPVGQLLALLLGRRGIDTIAVDAAAEPYDLPRAAVVDDEVLRIFQAAGVDEEILAAAQVQQAVSYVTDRGRAIEVFRPVEGELGHPPLVSIHQPTLERTLVAALDGCASVRQRWSCPLEDFEQHADHVVAQAGGETIRARYLVASDGGRSPVREQLGVAFGGSTFSQRWLVVDALVDRPLERVPHPHFIGDIQRPIVTLPMSPGRHRWEWMLHPGEDAEPFLDPGRIAALMAPWLRGEGATVERAVVYTFHARTAERWRDGRVLLAGDAAHVMPPFVGQGFSSGARDAANLAWKLEAVLAGAPDALLDSYETERRPHVTSMQKLAVRWGGVVQTTNARTGRFRDATIAALDRTGALNQIQKRAKPLPTYGGGCFVSRPRRLAPLRAVGALFPQPEVTAPDGRAARLDDVLGDGWTALTLGPDAVAGMRTLHVGRDVGDPTGAIATWLRRHHAAWVVLRPDRFVFAAGDHRTTPERTLIPW